MNIKKALYELMKPYQAAILRTLKSKSIPVVPYTNERPKTTRLNDKSGSIFFGYHDKTPFSQNGTMVLAHRVKHPGTNIESECKTIETGYFRMGSNGEFEPRFQKIIETDTWSWQQGSMLQWNPALPDQQIILNRMVDGKYGCLVFDIFSKKIIRQLKQPVYSLSNDGKKGISVNFSRLARLRPGYGYSRLPDATEGISAPSNDGLFILNMESEESELLFSLADIASRFGSADTGEHYINHANFSPDGTRLVYFHIWQPKNARRKIQLGIYDFVTGKNKAIESNRVVSHYCWKDDESLLVTTRDESLNWHYTLYNTSSGEKKDLNISLKSDGHPMYAPDSNTIVTDTTPDRRRDQHLCIANLNNFKVNELIPLYTRYKYRGAVRCDLHPRWDQDGTTICVDTTHWGKREMLLVKLPESVIKQFIK